MTEYNFSSKSNEWYTPKIYIDSVRNVLGVIDIDPATTAEINRDIIRAKTYYTSYTNGLDMPWIGKVFLNPPYGRQTGTWVSKLLSETRKGNTSEFILLVNGNTETQWFQNLLRYNVLVCLTHHRIAFINADGEKKKSPVRGNAFFYYGDHKEKFVLNFKQFGMIITGYEL